MTEVIDLRDGRWVLPDEPKRIDMAVERIAERTLDMAEPNVVVDPPGEELSEPVRELIAEALAAEDEPATADLSHDTNDEADRARARAWLVEAWGAHEDGRSAKAAVELAMTRDLDTTDGTGTERERLLEAWARQSG